MFKLATTSFIRSDTRINNALYLKNIVDEIELLYFESKTPQDFPDKHEIINLKKLNLKYNIHLPIDLSLSIKKNWLLINKYIDELKVLNPTTYTLHPENSDIFIENIIKFSNNHNISLENINSDLNIFDSLADTSITYCFDIGHAILHKTDIEKFLNKFENKISHIHLHGVINNTDHNSIKYLDKNLLNLIIEFAHKNHIVLCLELFNEANFIESLNILRSICEEKNYIDYRWNRQR